MSMENAMATADGYKLKGLVLRLQEQLQAERDLRAALEVGLSMSSGHGSGSNRAMDSKVGGSKDAPFETKEKKYGVYGFLDLELPGEYYKQLVYNLHEENKALKKNKMCGVMEDSRQGEI
ncbi:hypothetical protein Tco_1023857, partial [Tanacetum coccineum]